MGFMGKNCLKEKRIKELEKELQKYKRLSLRDDLTGLWNKRKLKRDVKRYKSLKERFGIKFLLMMIDLDKFKEINDRYGHAQGDKILKQVAKVLKRNIRDYENAYHIQGDEFVLVISHYKNYNTIKKRIKDNLKKIRVKACIGICDIDKKNCLIKADEQMYQEKKQKNENLN